MQQNSYCFRLYCSYYRIVKIKETKGSENRLAIYIVGSIDFRSPSIRAGGCGGDQFIRTLLYINPQKGIKKKKLKAPLVLIITMVKLWIVASKITSL
jgi:hypothetical protein